MTASNPPSFGASRRKPIAAPSRWGSVQVGRLGGVPVTVELGVTFLAALFILLLATQGFVRVAPSSSLTLRLVVATATIAVFLGSVLAHELGHAAMAKRFEVKVLGITLSLFGGYAQLERQAPSPTAEFAIAAAGPAVNIGLGGVLGVAALLLDQADFDAGTAGMFAFAACFWLAAVNLTLALLNLIPAAPLDGGRLVTAWLWRRSGDGELARVHSGRLGLGLGVLAVIAGIAQTTAGPMGLATIVVGAFIFQGARREIQGATLRRRLAGTTASQVMIPHPAPIADDLTLEGLTELARSAGEGIAHPVHRWGEQPIGYVLATNRGTTRPEHSWTSVSSLMHKVHEVARAWSNESLDVVLRRFSDRQELLVVLHDPQLGCEVGTLSYYQLRELLEAPDIWGRNRSERTT